MVYCLIEVYGLSPPLDFDVDEGSNPGNFVKV